jgi:hypothetical protein
MANSTTTAPDSSGRRRNVFGVHTMGGGFLCSRRHGGGFPHRGTTESSHVAKSRLTRTNGLPEPDRKDDLETPGGLTRSAAPYLMSRTGSPMIVASQVVTSLTVPVPNPIWTRYQQPPNELKSQE